MRPLNCVVCGESLEQSKRGRRIYCASCKIDKDKLSTEKSCSNPDNKLKLSLREKEKRVQLKNLIFDTYGRFCSCCGETRVEFLSLDHVGGWGASHRKELNNNQISLYKWVIKNDFPNSIRVLCFNCNQSHSIFGYCPHEKLVIIPS